MDIQAQIKQHISAQPEPKRTEMETLHNRILQIMPGSKLWFLDGTDDKGKVVTNPDIGYGMQIMKLAGGKTREFYQIGMSATKTGISIYIMGIANKKHLPETYGTTIGKADVTGYCIKFKSLKDINLNVLESAIRSGISLTS